MNAIVIGGAGFIGSNLTHRLLRVMFDCRITVFDNLSSGKLEYLDDIKDDPRLRIIIGDVKDLDLLVESMRGNDICYHFASNPDIAKAATEPTIDFVNGTMLTQNILEAMRLAGVKRIVYASGSGVYGNTDGKFVDEDYGPLLPVSTYGASKLAGEALICSYCHMFDMIGRTYRFANVVGKRQTHGVCKDFVEKLIKNPHQLEIWGNGFQSKHFIYIDDVLSGIAATKGGNKIYNYFNLATEDFISVTDIANIAVEEMKLKNVEYSYTGGAVGFRGDIAVSRFYANKARFYGWKPQYSSREAIRKSIKEILELKGYFN
jgi:UDP-glucose 4-epimerase